MIVTSEIDQSPSKYTIGKVAAMLAISTDTLRYYEKNGLITPTSKTAAGYRL